MTRDALNVFECRLSGTSLIEASAGTGKTWNLCGLYLRLLLERRLEVQQILVVTFTNAATAELRERIRARIAETLARLHGHGATSADPFVDDLLRSLRTVHGVADDDMARRLDLALRTFDEAAIFTIHGFCQRALADTAFSAGMPLAMELLSDDNELRLEVVHDFWRRNVAADALPAPLAAYLLSQKDSPQQWGELLRQRLARPLSRLIWPEGAADAPALDLAALREAHATAQASWAAERDVIVGRVIEALERLNGNSYTPASVATAAASWDRLLADSDPVAAPAKLVKLKLLTRTSLKPNKGKQGPQHHPFFDEAGRLLALLDGARQDLSQARLVLLRQLLTEGPATLRRAKQERRVVGFDDMLFNLYRQLTSGDKPWLAAALKDRFPAALIDEFQDTDPLQFAIFKTIYGAGDGDPPPLFLIGDPKQAIYSFRNADLHTYLQAKAEADAEYTLVDNQRSTRALLGGLNALFSANPQAFMLPGLDYQAVSCGQKPRQRWVDHTEARAPLQLWQLPSGADGQPLLKRLARRAAIAACAGEIARLIAAAQQGQIVLGEQPLSGGDIAVLVRSHAQAAEVRAALAALGVGSVELSQASIFDSPDAQDLERVLASILEPTRERLLRAALATDILGCDAHEIEAISADEPRLLAAMSRFSDYRDAWQRRGVGVMLRSLFNAEGVHARLLARRDGERRLTNLLHLSECLQQAAQTQGTPALQLRWLQTQLAGGAQDDAAQLRLESDRHLVQIVTIHKSKGLEYPVVFCPLLWDGHAGGSRSRAEGLAYHDDQGQPVLDFRGVGDAAVKAQMALDRSAENLRLVYVALTRAVQRCYLVVGSYTSMGFGHRSTAEGDRSLLNWLVAGAGTPAAEWRKHKAAAGEISEAWTRLSAAHAGSMALAPLPLGPWSAVTTSPLSPDALACLPAPARIPAAWWIGSYSSLSLGLRHEAAAVDHDTRVAGADVSAESEWSEEPDAADATETADAADAADARDAADAACAAPAHMPDADDILNFPRGPGAGNCLHAVFERVDFGDAATWPDAIASALADHPQRAADDVQAPLWPRMLERMLDDVLNTPLPGGTVLAQVPRQRRLVELEFNLPATHFSAQALVALLREYGYPVPALRFGVLEGYLRGFIDLVFEDRGRFFILDWKSNHLGRTAADYAPARVAAAMRAHGYHLQYLLYAVALHRYLRRRLAGYDYDRHFGGVTYLFVRGVRAVWTAADGAALGVYADRPPRALIERLSALFETAAEAA